MNRLAYLEHLSNELQTLKSNGLYKEERLISSSQSAEITLATHEQVINLCANNYLGLANHPRIIQAATNAMQTYGYGLSSVRFICGTQTIHKQLEASLSDFLGTEDTILYSSCFDANGGLFETLLSDEDAIISDALNHASIIDGIRLCKAKRYRYHNNDMFDLEAKLKEAIHANAKVKLIATDGVFSMDGTIADLKTICDLAERYDALVMVDDSHAVGFMGTHGRGTHEYQDVLSKIDIITGTLGKALGGASGGYTSGRKEIIAWLRQRSRPYLFSNTLAPTIAAASLEVLSLIREEPERIKRLHENSRYFRNAMEKLGFHLIPGDHPIIPVKIGDAKLATQMADLLLQYGIYVIGFSYPVVPMGKARIRTQISAIHTKEQLDRVASGFASAREKLAAFAEVPF